MWLAAVGALAPATAAAQRLTGTEVGVGGAAAFARRTFLGAEVGLGLRPGGQTRIALSLAGGTATGRAAGRAQLTLQFLVTPAARRGAAPYAGLGAAFAARRGTPGQSFVALLLGLEGSPGRRHGWQNWYLELGLGGGVRVAAGWRWRRLPAWWPRD